MLTRYWDCDTAYFRRRHMPSGCVARRFSEDGLLVSRRDACERRLRRRVP